MLSYAQHDKLETFSIKSRDLIRATIRFYYIVKLFY